MSKTATFLLYGDVLEHENKSQATIFGDIEVPGISSKDLDTFIQDNKGADELIIRINSRGGSIQEGFLMYDLLANSGKKITTIGEGKVYSIATVVFLAGSERIMMKHADGLIHLPFIPPYTLADKYESDDLERISKRLKQEEQKVAQFYSEKTGQTVEKLMEMMENETMLSADDMVDFGFATSVQEPLKAVAYFNYDKFKTNNKMTKAKEFEEKADGILAKFEAFLNKFSRQPDPQNLVIKDATGKELTVEREEGEIQVGDPASPDGEYTLEDGRVVTVTDGAIASIVDPEPDEDDEVEALKKENQQLKDKLAEFETRGQELVAKGAELEIRAQELEAQHEEIETLVTEMRELKSTFEAKGRSNNFKGQSQVFKADPARTVERLNKVLEQ